MKLIYNWVRSKSQYGSSTGLFLNGINIGNYDWNSSRSQTDTTPGKNWHGSLDLPSLRSVINDLFSDSEADIRQQMESLATKWFEKALG